MRRAVGRNHAEEMRIFVNDHHAVAALYDFPLIRDEIGSGHAGGATSGVLSGIVGSAHDLKLLSSGLERSRDGVVLAAHLHATEVERAGIVDSREIGLAVGHARRGFWSSGASGG